MWLCEYMGSFVPLVRVDISRGEDGFREKHAQTAPTECALQDRSYTKGGYAQVDKNHFGRIEGPQR